MPGLTFQGDLRHFWVEAQQQIPDIELYWKFRNYVVDQTQLNGSFYRAMPGGDASGLIGRVAPVLPHLVRVPMPDSARPEQPKSMPARLRGEQRSDQRSVARALP